MSQAIGQAIIKFVTAGAVQSAPAWVANVVGTTALMVGSNLLTPKARFGNVKERDSLNIRGINSRGATDSRSYIYGQVRVGGTVVYMETTGTDNEFLHMVLVHCDHEVEELGDVYVNDVKVVFDSGSEGSLRNAQGTRYRNSLYIADHLGGPSQTVDSTLDAASGKWGSNDKLSGMAYTYIRMELKTGEDNAFPNGIPTFTRVVKGRKVYDPRLDSTQTGIGGSGSHRADDSTTWEWSNNWALCVADYITSDFGYGRFGNSWSNINIAELDASADNCDETVNEVFASWSNGETVSEGWRRSVDVYLLRANNDGTTGSTIPDHTGWSVGDTVNDGTVVWTVELASLSQTTTRYKLDGIVEADEDPLEVVKEMKGAAAGFIEYIGGSWVITSGRYQAPTITLTESDFAGPITGTSKDDRTRAINGVRGVIANQDDAYNVIDVPPISSAAYVTEDNGVESFRDLKLLYTTSTSAAQRLFKIELLRARQSLAFRSTFTASAFRLKAGDTFSLDFDRYGWSGKVFQVWSSQLKVGGDGELVVDMEFRETASNVYSYTAITDETVVDPAPNTNLPDPYEVTAPTGMAAASGTDQLIETSDGTILPTVLVTWTAAASVNVIGYQIRWRLASESSDQDYRYLTVNGRNNTSSVITGVRESRGDANQYIDIDIRSLTPVKEGEWTVVEHDHDVVGKSAAPSTPTGPGTGSKPEVTPIVEGLKIEMDEGKLSDLDFFNYHIWVKTTNSPPTYNSTTKLYSEIATTSTSGTTKTVTDLIAGQDYYVWVAAMDGGRRFGSLTEATPFPAVPATNFLDVSTQTLGVQIEVGQSGVPSDWSDYDMTVGLYVEGATATYVSSTPTSSGEFTITAESATPSGWTMLSSGSYPTVGIRGRPNSYGNREVTKTYTIDYMDARGVIHELQIVRQWHIMQRYVLGPPRFNPITLPTKGGSGLDFKINYTAATTANDGEVFVAGTTFTKPNGTTTTGISENYVGTPYEGAISPVTGSTGDFWLMWTDTAADTRFSPLTFTHQNVVPIRESTSGGYEVLNNAGTAQAITFASTDVLLAAVWRDDSTTGITGIEEYVDKNPGQSKNFATGVSGYKIDAETGDAEFNDVTVRGDLVAGTIDIGAGSDSLAVNSSGVATFGPTSSNSHIKVEADPSGGTSIDLYNATATKVGQIRTLNGQQGGLLSLNRGDNSHSTSMDGGYGAFYSINTNGSEPSFSIRNAYVSPTRSFTIGSHGELGWGTGSISPGGEDTNLYRDSANVLRTDDLLKVGLGITSFGGIDIDETATAQLRMFNRSNVNDSNDYWDIRHANGGQLQFLYRDNSAGAWDHYTEFMEDGSILIQQDSMRLWNYTSANSDITALTTGSTFGALIEGDQSGHLVLGIRGNDSSDGLYIIKDETNSSGRGSYDTMLLRVDSNIGVQTGNAINLEVQGNTKTNLYHSTLNDGYAYFRYGSSTLVDFQLRVNSGNLEYSVNAGSSWNTIATV